MIRKISRDEYLKRLDDMTSGERDAYIERVGQWVTSGGQALARRTEAPDARLQNVLQVSGGWNDDECQAFEEGARLISALAGTADTWLPDMLYVKSARRSVRLMFDLLWDAEAGNGGAHAVPGTGKAKEEPAEGTGKAAQAVAPFREGSGDDSLAGGDHKGEAEVTPAPVRPKHVDQYAHLLPQKTQEHAAQLQGLYRELEDARRKMDLLMEDETASPADREAWAKKATGTDNRIRKILDELDREWARLVKEGRVVVDDLGNARIVEVKNGDDADPGKQELTSEQKARRRELRKWLVDTRRGNGDSREEHVKKWKEGFKEFLTYDGDAAFEDEKVMAAAEHYGIKLKRPKK